MELNQIKARLESLHELGELVGALRSMAASRAQEAQEALAGTRAYRAIVEHAIDGVMPLAGARSDDTPTDHALARHLLVVTSENGFVGGFNSRLIERATALRQKNEGLVIIGQRGLAVAAENGITDVVRFSMTSRIQGVTRLSRRIVASLGDSASARIVFAKHQTGASYEVTEKQLLPVAPRVVSDDKLPPVIQLPPNRLLASLMDEYLFAEIAHSLMESLASENSARLAAMDSASRNIDDKLEVLERDARVAWQEETTSDMLDVVTGAEAVNRG